MAYDTNNIFAKILRQEIPAKKIYEDDLVLAFHDIAKASPTHILVIPKGQYENYCDFVLNAKEQVVVDFFKRVALIAKEHNLQVDGFRLISNQGSDANQTVRHFHVHLLAGKKLGPLIASDKILR